METNFVNKVNYLIEVKRYTRIKIAKRLGIKTRTLYNYLKKDRSPKINLMNKLMEEFKDDFINENLPKDRDLMGPDSIFEKIRNILDSKTEYSSALKLIIDSLHTAVIERRELLGKNEETQEESLRNASGQELRK